MKFITKDDTLILKFEGMERLWALRGTLQIPRFAVLDVDFNAGMPILQDYQGYLRFPGSNWFWRFFAGSFMRGGEREFWYVRMQSPGVLLIELKPETYAYRRIRLSCTPEMAQAVADWWHHGKPEQA